MSTKKCFLLRCFVFDDIAMTSTKEYALASFNSLKYLQRAECNICKYKLSYKPLNPSTFEKQIVKLVLQIFNNFTSAVLVLLGKELRIPNYKTTSVFVKIIVTWWQILNIKTP